MYNFKAFQNFQRILSTTATNIKQHVHEPSTPLPHRLAASAASAWLVPPQAFPLDTSKSSPWCSVNAQTQLNISRSCWMNLY